MAMDWRTRLAVTYQDPVSKADVNISPIDSFSPSFALGVEPLHSIEQTHIGAVYSPKSITFSLTVKAIGPVAAQLTKLALEGTRFDITLGIFDGTDWAFNQILLHDCIITSASPTAASPTGAPTATFSGFSMQATSTPADASVKPTTVPNPPGY
jgi:hypothetical protein